MTNANHSGPFSSQFRQQLSATNDANAQVLASADFAIEQVLPSFVDSVSLTYTSSGSRVSLMQSVSGGPFVSSWDSYGPMELSTADESASVDVGFVKGYIPSTLAISIGNSLGEASGSTAVYTEASTSRTGSTSVALDLNKQITILISMLNPQTGPLILCMCP